MDDDGLIKVHALRWLGFKLVPVYFKTDSWEDAKFIIEQIDADGLPFFESTAK